jgi:4-hydroxybenzoate polyprenyltransferase
MMVWGVAMPSVALPPDAPIEGWLLLGQLGLFSGVFETIQVMRDHDEDAKAGVRTSAVALGLPRMKMLVRLLLVAAGAYAGVFFHPALAVVPLLLAGTKIPEPATMHQYWNRVRLGLGIVFVAECAWVWGTM